MPNAHGLHKKGNPKLWDLPAQNIRGEIIGYTGELNDYPTVYFTQGHYTQRHPEKWDVGWESCLDWQCMFLGNVPNNSDESSHFTDLNNNKHLIAPSDYVKKLNDLANNANTKNRVNGGPSKNLSSWDLTTPDHAANKHLREFWTRTVNLKVEQFAHPSRHSFIPVLPGDRATLLGQLANVMGPQVNAHLISVNGQWRLRF